eukprot:TRINITY_DN22765_c0_g1_i2.p1 TRINITY_DN22765_c0_g1~~TRINITY_DN22765_c0_g1_i2.p1  ORF type:complete len:406 (-),score=99.99 TRINITY_DN22765_c0_g1_i2:42-1259(-)
MTTSVAFLIVPSIPVQGLASSQAGAGVSHSWLGVDAIAASTGVPVPDRTAMTLAGLMCTLAAARRIRQKQKGRRAHIQMSAVAETDAVKEALKQKEAEYRQKRQSELQRSDGEKGDIPELSSLPRTTFVGEDGLLQVPQVSPGVRASVYAIFSAEDSGGKLQYVGVSRNSQTSLRAHFARRPEDCGSFAVFDVLKPDRALLEAARKAWFSECGIPSGNSGGVEQAVWEEAINVKVGEVAEALSSLTSEAADAALRKAVLAAETIQVEKFEAVGCHESLLFDTKLKAKGLLDLDTNAPVGLRRPEGGVGATFQVSLKMPDGKVVDIECPPDITILDAAEEAGLELPSSCKSGACSACAGKVLEGTIDQSDQSYLDDAQQEAGYVLTCACYPRSNIVIETNKQSEVV